MKPRHANVLALVGVYSRAQTMTEYALVLAGLALVAYGLSPTSGYNFLDDAITKLISKVTSLL